MDESVTPPAHIEALAIRLALTLAADNRQSYRRAMTETMADVGVESQVITTLVTSLVELLNTHEPAWADETEARLLELVDQLAMYSGLEDRP